ncbi:MAG: hypothetical protein U9P12_07075 [Verrucomicrobiota bacterium]|nr:hypothetical protein [Verrucomicrobiota bacterium]
MMVLNEQLANVIENTACRVAQLRSGRLAPHHVMPYLPVSLEMLCDCLNGMVDGAAVLAESNDGIREYVFSAYADQPPGGSVLSVSSCVACSEELVSSSEVICKGCAVEFRRELSVLAEKNGWPAQAVYEHEILYLAAKEKGSIAAETLAGASRYTLRSMKKKLAIMAESHFLKAEPGNKAGTLRYCFPPLMYPKNRFLANQEIIRSYPASVMEDVEQRTVRILFVLGSIFIAMLALAFWGIPFPLLVPAFLVVAPVAVFVIWRHKDKIKEI